MEYGYYPYCSMSSIGTPVNLPPYGTEMGGCPCPKRKRNNLKILVGVTGSVATIKLCELVDSIYSLSSVKELVVVATENSEKFLDPEEIASVGEKYGKTEVKIWRDCDEWDMWNGRGDPVLHIELGKWADALILAPLDANTMAKISHGICDNLLTCILRAWDLKAEKPVIFCPAMNTKMWEHPLTRVQVQHLQDFGYECVPPIEKTLMCGDTGIGAMASVDTIVNTFCEIANVVCPSCGRGGPRERGGSHERNNMNNFMTSTPNHNAHDCTDQCTPPNQYQGAFCHQPSPSQGAHGCGHHGAQGGRNFADTCSRQGAQAQCSTFSSEISETFVEQMDRMRHENEKNRNGARQGCGHEEKLDEEANHHRCNHRHEKKPEEASEANEQTGSQAASATNTIYKSSASPSGVGASVTPSGQASVTPSGQASVSPSKSGASPSKSGATPSKSGATPSKSGASPSKSGATPSKSGASPSKSGASPSKLNSKSSKLGASGSKVVSAKGSTNLGQSGQTSKNTSTTTGGNPSTALSKVDEAVNETSQASDDHDGNTVSVGSLEESSVEQKDQTSAASVLETPDDTEEMDEEEKKKKEEEEEAKKK